ncbi:LuxR C-terminal-related transcriptional regulator [Streptomyces sp. NPDC101227]|uniref:LuxR C-terminal-related transcriptional regulator n=1 Tax=Streptomyces sp. NPDC101227 TaxID=3366136 RepID=UPI00382E2F21
MRRPGSSTAPLRGQGTSGRRQESGSHFLVAQVAGYVTRLGGHHSPGHRHEPHPALSASQERILSLLAADRSNAGISASLHLSRQTIGDHLSRLRALGRCPTGTR